MLLLLFSMNLLAQVEEVNYLQETQESFDQRMEWWRNAKFGMFIHWGVYTVPAGEYKGKEIKGIGEWIQKNGQIPAEEYQKFAKQFNPVQFDAKTWVSLMKEAGMKYMVITSKHHDGFALWDSKVSDYDIVEFAPYGKDVLKALSDECKKQGIKFGLYYSIMDWHHKDAHAYSYLKKDPRKRKDNMEHFARYLEDYMKPQLKEIVENYDPDILWFDGEWEKEYTHEQGQQIYQFVRSMKPEILINNRVDKGRAGMQGMDKGDKDYAGDFGTPEQEILEGSSTLDWESCMTMNDTWGFKKNDHNWKESDTLIHNLIDVTAKGGNYLLNVGPTAEGLIPQPSVERLQKMGDWLKTNGEAIYNTSKLDKFYKQGESLLFTKNETQGLIYVFSLEKPTAEIKITSMEPESRSEIYLLGFDQPLSWNYNSSTGLKIKLHQDALNHLNESGGAWVFKIKGKELVE